MDWNDIPFVLAVCETGSLSGAARKLGVHHSTVFRRIESVEANFGVTLFERRSHGYVMTVAGEEFYRQSRTIRDGVNRIQMQLGGQDLRLEGSLTVTTTDSLLYWLAPVFRDFQEAYPDVELRLLSDSRALDLMQREADIAVRPTRRPPENWIGRNLLSISYATYAHAGFWDKCAALPVEQQRWLRLEDSLSQSPMNRITAKRKPEPSPVTIASSVMGMFDLVRVGLGIAVLPTYMKVNCPELIQLFEPDPDFDVDLWMLAHPDIRRSAKVHAFFEFATMRIRSLATAH